MTSPTNSSEYMSPIVGTKAIFSSPTCIESPLANLSLSSSDNILKDIKKEV